MCPVRSVTYVSGRSPVFSGHSRSVGKASDVANIIQL